VIIDIHPHIVDPKEGQSIAAEPDAKVFSLTWLLEQQEQEKVTQRVGDQRVLR